MSYLFLVYESKHTSGDLCSKDYHKAGKELQNRQEAHYHCRLLVRAVDKVSACMGFFFIIGEQFTNNFLQLRLKVHSPFIQTAVGQTIKFLIISLEEIRYMALMIWNVHLIFIHYHESLETFSIFVQLLVFLQTNVTKLSPDVHQLKDSAMNQN